MPRYITNLLLRHAALCIAILAPLAILPGLSATAHANEHAAKQADAITVFAAASLSDALEEIAENYQRQYGAAHTVRFNFAASSTLARQIREGAPADIIFSADNAQMDTLASRDLLAPGTHCTVLANQLVIVVNAAATNTAPITAAADLLSLEIRRIAIGEPDTVPAGVYARKWLTHAGLWEKLQASSKLIPCENVRAALAAVESGNADAAIVYSTDGQFSKKTRIALAIPTDETPGIEYPMAILKNSPVRAAAEKFATYMLAPESLGIFKTHGFRVLSETATNQPGGHP